MRGEYAPFKLVSKRKTWETREHTIQGLNNTLFKYPTVDEAERESIVRTTHISQCYLNWNGPLLVRMPPAIYEDPEASWKSMKVPSGDILILIDVSRARQTEGEIRYLNRLLSVALNGLSADWGSILSENGWVAIASVTSLISTGSWVCICWPDGAGCCHTERCGFVPHSALPYVLWRYPAVGTHTASWQNNESPVQSFNSGDKILFSLLLLRLNFSPHVILWNICLISLFGGSYISQTVEGSRLTNDAPYEGLMFQM